jgi:hypothetical protein
VGIANTDFGICGNCARSISSASSDREVGERRGVTLAAARRYALMVVRDAAVVEADMVAVGR